MDAELAASADKPVSLDDIPPAEDPQ